MNIKTDCLRQLVLTWLFRLTGRILKTNIKTKDRKYRTELKSIKTSLEPTTTKKVNNISTRLKYQSVDIQEIKHKTG